jgi:hypothetical protein
MTPLHVEIEPWQIAGSNGLFYEIRKPDSGMSMIIRQSGVTVDEAKANIEKIIEALNGTDKQSINY